MIRVSEVEARVVPLLTDDVLRLLTPRQEQVLRLRYGIGEGRQTYRVIAERFAVCPQRIRQLVIAALRKVDLSPRLTAVTVEQVLASLPMSRDGVVITKECLGALSFGEWLYLKAPLAGISDEIVAQWLGYVSDSIPSRRGRLIARLMDRQRKRLHRAWSPHRPFPTWVGWIYPVPPSTQLWPG